MKKIKFISLILITAMIICIAGSNFSSVTVEAEDNTPWLSQKVMTNIEFVDKAVEIALGRKTVYAKGMYGHLMEKGILSSKTAQYGNWYTSQKVAYLTTTIGQACFGFDCVNLVKAILWGWSGVRDKPNANSGGAVYQDNYVPDETESYYIEDGCTNVSSDFTNIMPGEFLYRNGHCGIYIGDGLAVECTTSWENAVQVTAVGNIGTKPGFQTQTWEEHGKLKCIEYIEEDQQQGMLSLDKTEYRPGEPIKITVKGLNSSEYINSWVGIYPSTTTNYAASNASLGMWCYVRTGSHEASTYIPPAIRTVELTANSVDLDKNIKYSVNINQDYKVVLFKDNGYTELAHVDFEVTGAKIIEAKYANGWVDVSIEGYLQDDAWIGVYSNSAVIYDPLHKSIEWHYMTPDAAKKTTAAGYYYTTIRLEANLSSSAAYKVVLFADDGYKKVSQLTIDFISSLKNEYVQDTYVIGNAKIEVSRNQYYPGEEFDVYFSGIENTNTWIGLYPQSTTDYSPCSTGMWCYTSTGAQWGDQLLEMTIEKPEDEEGEPEEETEITHEKIIHSGKVTLSANILDVDTGTKHYLTPGQYKLVLFGDGGYNNVLDTVNITIRQPSLSIAFSGLSSSIHELNFYGAPSKTAWVGLYESSTTIYNANHPSLVWKRVEFKDIPEGKITLYYNVEINKSYKFVLFADDEYTKVAECSVTY